MANSSRPESAYIGETFGQALRRYRDTAELSQASLAARLPITQASLSRYERGLQNPPGAAMARQLDEALHAGGALVRLADLQRRAKHAMNGGADMTTVSRRDFLQNVMAASVGAAAPEAFEHLLHGITANERVPHHVGVSEVEAVEAATDLYMNVDLARCRDIGDTVARSVLQWSTTLLKQNMTDPTRTRLSSAIGLLADRWGWELYDHGQGTRAVQVLTAALDHAARGADSDLRAHVMLDLSSVVTDAAGRPDDGVSLLRAALGHEGIGSAERANAHGVCARHCAGARMTDAGLRHIALGEDALGDDKAAAAPEWARRTIYSPGHHASVFGISLFALGADDPARALLTTAVRSLDGGRTRTGLRCRTRLAALAFRAGDRDEGEREGRRALADSAGVQSARIRRDLEMLRRHAVKFGAPDLAADLSTRLAA